MNYFLTFRIAGYQSVVYELRNNKEVKKEKTKLAFAG
jgi:hypothetical protein